MNAGIFASPDETAVNLFSEAWTPSGGFRIHIQGDEAVKQIAALHPRSMIRQGDWLVPVGFLGMPFIIAMANRIASSAGLYVTLLLTLSAAYPLFRLLKWKLGAFTSWSAVILFLSFPTVLLYVNRGLFPNLPVVACAIWGIWLAVEGTRAWLRDAKRDAQLFLGASGFAFGCALLIRPIEAVWMLPWMVWSLYPAWREKKTFAGLMRFLAPFISVLALFGALGLGLSMSTYPFHASLLRQPISGYQLKDYLPFVDSGRAAMPSAADAGRDIRTLVPFSFHPRVVLTNIRIFFFEAQGVWFSAAMIGGICAWFAMRKRSLCVLGLSAWTVVSFCLLYGQVLYADNINGVPTLGNSFLRYALPIVPLLAIGCAVLADALRRISARGYVLGVGLVVFLSAYGIAYAASGDGESILATQRQIARYVQIRNQADIAVPHDAVILSERSDKVFASGPWVVASPIPDLDSLTRLRYSEAQVYLFHRLVETDRDLPKDIANGFYVADPVVILDNEALYPLYGVTD